MCNGDLWLAHWVTEDAAGNVEEGDNLGYAGVYAVIATVHSFFMIGAGTILAEACLRASGNVHRDSLVRILKAPMGWFESIPSGRILTRFSSDLTVVDIQL